MQQKRDLEAFRHKRFVEDGAELPALSAMHTAGGDAPPPDCSRCIIHFDVDCFYAQVPAFVLHTHSSLPGMSCSCQTQCHMSSALFREVTSAGH